MMYSLYKQFLPVFLGTAGGRVKIVPSLSQLLGARERKCCLGEFLDSVTQIHKDFHAPYLSVRDSSVNSPSAHLQKWPKFSSEWARDIIALFLLSFWWHHLVPGHCQTSLHLWAACDLLLYLILPGKLPPSRLSNPKLCSSIPRAVFNVISYC